MNDHIRNVLLVFVAGLLAALVGSVDRLTTEVQRARLTAEHPPTMHVQVVP